MLTRRHLLGSVLPALAGVGGCAGGGGLSGWAEPGAPARPLRTPLIVTVRFDTAQEVFRIARAFGEPGRAAGFHGGVGAGRVIYAPAPRAYDDLAAWRLLFHELRHANGERHDDKGWWIE